MDAESDGTSARAVGNADDHADDHADSALQSLRVQRSAESQLGVGARKHTLHTQTDTKAITSQRTLSRAHAHAHPQNTLKTTQHTQRAGALALALALRADSRVGGGSRIARLHRVAMRRRRSMAAHCGSVWQACVRCGFWASQKGLAVPGIEPGLRPESGNHRPADRTVEEWPTGLSGATITLHGME